MSDMVVGTFGATGTSKEAVAAVADISISGGATATVEIQRKVNGNWVVIEEITEDAERVVENGNGMPIRLECTAYTSGTVSYAILPR